MAGIQACLASLHAEAHAERVGEAAQRLCMFGDEAALRPNPDPSPNPDPNPNPNPNRNPNPNPSPNPNPNQAGSALTFAALAASQKDPQP